MKITYTLNGNDVNPVKRDDIYLEVNHDQASIINQPRPHVGINNLFFAREDVQRVMNELMNVPGITEGIPFDINITERGVTETISMYLNCMEGFLRSNDGISATVKMLQSLDWLDDKVDAFTFESMYNETGVPSFVIDGITYSSYQSYFDSKCIFVPYVISSIPDWHDAFLSIFAMTYCITELRKCGKAIMQWASPSIGAGAVVHVLQIVLEVLYLILILVTLISLIAQLIACLIQPVKYHGAMLMTDMLKVVAVKLGLKEQSSIWDTYPYNQIAYLPEKYNPVEGSPSSFNLLGQIIGGFGTSGYTSPAYASGVHDSQTPNIQHGYFNGTGGDFLRLLKSFCNGKIIIPDQTNDMVIERRDYYPSSTPYQLPDLRQDWNEYNPDELSANILIKFLSDLNDKNCIDHISPSGVPFYPGTILQATHQQITTINQSMVCLKGLREINIAAARGVAKDKLTFVEQVVKDLEVVWNIIIDILIAGIDPLIIALDGIIITINTLINVLNVLTGNAINIPTIPTIPLISFVPLSNSNFADRLNALLLENDMVSTPKLLLVDTSRSDFTDVGGITGKRIAYLHNDNATVINSQWLWDKFYSIDAFVNPANVNDKVNRFTKISPALNKDSDKNKCILSLAGFKNLVSNPKFLDNFGEDVIADSIAWYIEQDGSADFAFRKSGWLKQPQNPDATKRQQEIAINLDLKISLPNGQ